MEENTPTNATTNPSGGNSMMLIIGAIVLAAILGYVIFSSANSNDTNDVDENQDIAKEQDDTNDDQNRMMQEDQVNNDADDQTLQAMPPEAATMELNLNDTGAGAEMDTSTTNPNVKTIEMEAGSFYYKPNVINAKKGDTIRVVMKSVDMMHDFNIDELGVKMPITKSGESNTVEFTVNETGEFQFYCSVGQHRQQGQIGTLIVQ